MKELENLILVCDTREKSVTRIRTVTKWFESHGGYVERAAVKLGDYKILGEFRDLPVNIVIEYKSWDNFLSDNIEDMEEKLLLATEEYNHVGFFVETQNYIFVPDENNKHGNLKYSIPSLNKNLPSKTLAAFEGLLDTISKHPQIHVRQLRSEAQFPYSLYDLLVYTQNPHVIKARRGVYRPYLLNLYMQIPEVGIVRAKRLMEHYPNPFWLCSASEDSLKEVLGKKTGEQVYGFLRNPELVTEEWLNGHHLDGTDVLMCEYEKKPCSEANAYQCVGSSCKQHPDYNKLLPKKSQDDEGRQAFDAPAKNPVKPCQYDDEKNCAMINKQCTVTCSLNPDYKKCAFANPKNHAECKTPDHFKQHSSHSGKDIASVEHGISPQPSLPDDKLNSHEVRGSFKKALPVESQPFTSDNLQSSGIGERTGQMMHGKAETVSLKSASVHDTSEGKDRQNPELSPSGIFSHASGAILSSFVPQPPNADTPSHTSTNFKPPLPKKLDDPQSLPPVARKSEVKQEGFLEPYVSPPAQIDIGLNSKPSECIVTCRACRQVIIPEQDDDTGFCKRPECIAERNKPKQKMNLKDTIKDFMQDNKPHTMQEIVDKCIGWSPCNVFEHVMGGVKSDYFKKITEQNDKITFQKVN